MTTAQVILNAYAVALFCVGTFLWVRYFIDGKRPAYNVRTWAISSLDFGLITWALLGVILLSQAAAQPIVQGANLESPAWKALIASACMHGGILLLCLGIYFKKRALFFGEISSHRLNALQALLHGFYGFMMAMPVIWIMSKAWQLFLKTFYSMGVDFTASPQALVEIIVESSDRLPVILMGILAIFIAPITEEIVFRGLLYRYFKSRIQPGPALLLSSLLFACMHFNLLSFLPLFIFGLLLGRNYERTGSIKVPIVIHALFNANTYLVLLIQPEVVESIGMLTLF